MYLEFPEEAVDWCVKKLAPLLGLRSAPKSMYEKEHYAAAILRIAHPEIVELRCLSPRTALKEEIVIAALAIRPKLLEGVRIQRPKLGSVNPLNWLINVCSDTARFCPAPIEMRIKFVDHFPCADGNDDFGDDQRFAAGNSK